MARLIHKVQMISVLRHPTRMLAAHAHGLSPDVREAGGGRPRTAPASPMGLRYPASHRVTLRLPSLSGSDGIPYRSVPEWLESIRMKRYILHFRSAGLDTMECVLELTAE